MKQDHFLLPTVNYICFTVTPVPLREKYASLNMTDTALSDQDIIATHLSLLPSIRIVVPSLCYFVSAHYHVTNITQLSLALSRTGLANKQHTYECEAYEEFRSNKVLEMFETATSLMVKFVFYVCNAVFKKVTTGYLWTDGR